jgi:hypothetical protein
VEPEAHHQTRGVSRDSLATERHRAADSEPLKAQRLPVVAFLAVGFAVSVDVLLTEEWDTHQPIFCASSTMIPAGPRT